MSFRKRSEVIGTGATPAGREPVPPRNPLVGTPRTPAPARGPPSINAVPRSIPKDFTKEKSPDFQKNPAIRPSVITSQPTISTGTADLDRILQHAGLPLGCSLLVEESGTTDFASVLLRAMASQGVMHNRITKDQHNCHVVVIGAGSDWANQLPGLYKGSSKDKKKALISSNESQISVTNLAQSSSGVATSREKRDLKIAWRYGLNKKLENGSEPTEKSYEHYNNQFDLTERLNPSPSHLEMSFVRLQADFKPMLSQVSGIIIQQLKTNPLKTIRIIIPGLLAPSVYFPQHSQLSFVIPFVHGLRSLLKQYPTNVVLMASIALDLYPRESLLTAQIEQLVDSCIHLQPFNQEMSQFIEKAYKSEPSKVQHGLVNVIKLPVLSDRGLMTRHDGEFAFKNGRKKFEIEEWGIPVEDDSNDKQETQTTKNIDF